MFSSIKSDKNSANDDIFGVLIYGKNGEVYVICQKTLLLEASLIKAEHLSIKANSIEIVAMKGLISQNFAKTSQGFGFSFTAKENELSVGAGFYKNNFKLNALQEFAVPSGLIGNSLLKIKADNLKQVSSHIGGGIGKIKVNNWTAEAMELKHSQTMTQTQISAGVKFGVQQHLTSTVRGINNTIQSADQGGKFAALNTASNIYSNIQDVANLMTGNVVSIGPSASVSMSHARASSGGITHVMSSANFGHIEAEASNIDGDLEMNAGSSNIKAESIELTRPVDTNYSSSSQTNASVSNSGVSFAHYQEKDGEGFGFGFSTSWDSLIGNNLSESKPAFGPTISVRYKSGDDELNASYAHANVDEVKKIFSNISTERFKDNFNRLYNEVKDLRDAPINYIAGKIDQKIEEAKSVFVNDEYDIETNKPFNDPDKDQEIDELLASLDNDQIQSRKLTSTNISNVSSNIDHEYFTDSEEDLDNEEDHVISKDNLNKEKINYINNLRADVLSNPVQFTHQELSEMSLESYTIDKQELIKEFIQNDIVFSKTDIESPGYLGIAFIKDGFIALASRGSDLSGCGRSVSQCITVLKTDISDDIKVAFDQIPDRFKHTEDFLLKLQKDYPNHNIILTGHSLSGPINDLLSIKYGIESVSFDSPGSLKIARKMFSDELINKNKHLIHSYKSTPNFINTTGKPISENIIQINIQNNEDHKNRINSLDCSIKNLPASHSNIMIFVYGTAILVHETLFNHSMKNINDAFDNQIKIEKWNNNYSKKIIFEEFVNNHLQNNQCYIQSPYNH